MRRHLAVHCWPVTLAGLATALLVAIFIGNVLLTSAAVDAGSTPSLSFSPASGPAGTKLQIRGQGFPRRTAGTMSFGGEVGGMPKVQTDQRGAFTVSVAVPNKAAGAYAVSATVGSSTAGARFTLTTAAPSPTPTPSPTPSPTATPSPTPSPSPTASPTPSPTTTTPTYAVRLSNVAISGGDVSADVGLQTNQGGTVLVDLLAYQNGVKIKETSARGVANGQTVRLTLAALPAGPYDLTVGLFTDDADWVPLLGWYPNLATAAVGAAASPSPTAGPTPAPAPSSPPAGGDLVNAAFEHRPENATANRTTFGAPNPAWRDMGIAASHYDRISGMKTGTTAEILLWAADAWGVPRSLVLAQAWKESGWKAAMLGDYQTGLLTAWGDFRPADYQSRGPLQVKRFYHPDSFPKVAQSTAYGASYGLAIMREMYDGASWLGDRTRGNWDACLEAYFYGQPGTASGIDYRQSVRRIEAEQPWKALER